MFFSVKKPIAILGKTYIPCVCYDIPKYLERTVEKLVADGIAKVYENEVGFMNGKVLEKTKKTSKKTAKKEIKEETVEEPKETTAEILDETTGF